MSESKKVIRPLHTVMIRRGDKVVKDIPTKILVSYIKGRKLLRTDSISGDGVKWTRLDQHFQLFQYFKDETSPEIFREASSSFPQDKDSEHSENSLTSLDNKESASPPPTLSKVENQLNQMAEMLKDLNR